MRQQGFFDTASQSFSHVAIPGIPHADRGWQLQVPLNCLKYLRN